MKMENNNSYVKIQITKSLLKLMETNDFDEIKITHIAKEAMVGRASFYRNFSNKEDVIKQYLLKLIKEWGIEFEKGNNPDLLIESLFSHYKKYGKHYKLLFDSNLSYLVLDNIKAVCGPKSEQTPIEAYRSAWFANGLFGWIEEWIKRGMKESPEEMAKLVKDTEHN